MSGFGDTTDNEGQVSKTRPPLFGGRRSTILLMVKSISRDWGRLDFLRKGSKLVFLEYNANGQFLFLDLKNEFGILAHAAPRCKAKSKRTGLRCRSPAVNGYPVCRMHGAGGGAPVGKRNGNFRHGGRRGEVITQSRFIRAMPGVER